MVAPINAWSLWSSVSSLPLVLVLLAASADAQEQGPPPLEKLITEADLVFEGTVEKIQYSNSAAAGPKQAPIPHTFVTYKISNVFKGRSAGEKYITLRFMGGPLEKPRFLMLSGMPAIDEGDRDILFVRGNGKSICPLVACDQGRIRVINNMVYDEYGHALVLSKTGSLLLGRQHEKNEVITHYVAGTRFNRIAHDSLPGDAAEETGKKRERASKADVPKGEELDLKTFTSHLSATLGKFYDRSVLAKGPAAASIDPSEQFTVDLSPAPFRQDAR